jgi:hypothetical protein
VKEELDRLPDFAGAAMMRAKFEYPIWKQLGLNVHRPAFTGYNR